MPSGRSTPTRTARRARRSSGATAESGRMAGSRITAARIVLCLLAVGIGAAPALGDDIVGKKRAVDAQIDQLSGQLAAKRQSEQALRNEIDSVTERIRQLEANVGDVSLKLSTLEQDLELH